MTTASAAELPAERLKALAAIQDAAKAFGDAALEITQGWGDVFGGFNCAEVDALARLLKLTGQHDAAAHVIARHAEGDDQLSPEEVAAGVTEEYMDLHDHIAHFAASDSEDDWATARQMAEEYVKTL